MRVYLMRHATAEDAAGGSDAARRLTDQGRREAKEAGEAIRDRNAAIARILSSPRLRARETAEIAASAMGTAAPVVVRDGLACGATSRVFLEEIQSGEGDVLLVAHNPELSAFASALASQAISFRPSTVCCIELVHDDARLEWLRHPVPGVQ